MKCDNVCSSDPIPNILLGIFTSSLVTTMVSFITYLTYRREILKKYISVARNLHNHCNYYVTGYDIENKLKWYDKYVEYLEELGDINRDIGFVLDIFGKGKYLNDLYWFYNDFILLTEDEYQKIISSTNNPLMIQNAVMKIDGIVIKNQYNGFTEHIEQVIYNLTDIYKFFSFKRIKISYTLVSKDNFYKLNEDSEKFVKQIIKYINDKKSNTIKMLIPDNVMEELQRGNYVNDDSIKINVENEIVSFECKGILYSYFELKKELSKINVFEDI